ncbi:MAG: S41 family peptidase [Acidobacteriota bacterium]|nr:S41 family peptidase [Acidobacteriota bacterium]
MEIFVEVWQTINDKYYDPSFNGVGWLSVRERYRPRVEAAASDMEFYGTLETMLAELRDNHTRFFGPPPPGVPQDGQPSSLGLSLGEAEGQTVVTEVESDSAAARAGVRPGMTLRTINKRPVENLYAEIRANFAGASSERSFKSLMRGALLYGGFLSSPRTLGLVDFDGNEFSVTLERQLIAPPPHVTSRRLAFGYGYIKFDSWTPPADARFGEELDKLRDTPGLVIDLRGNGGGQSDVLLNIASNFFAEKTYYGGFKTRAGTLDKYYTHRPARAYDGAVVILVDERSASASETFTIFMQERGRAKAVGRPSAGSTLNQTSKHLKGGATLRYSIRAYISPQGRNPEGTGVIPDQVVDLKIADLRQGRDAALEAAEQMLKGALSVRK